MKNTIRVRKNRSAATRAPQAKTGRGEVTAEFDLPKPLHQAMICEARKKRISPQKFFENALKAEIQNPPNTFVVIFYSRKTGEEYARVEFPNAIYAAILRVCKKLNCTVERFFELAVRSKIEKDTIKPNPRAPRSVVKIVLPQTGPMTGGAR